MKALLMMISMFVAAAVSVPAQAEDVKETKKNYTGSYDAGGCNADAKRDEQGRLLSWGCPQPLPTDEGLGGTGNSQ